MRSICIVGSSLAGWNAALALRREGYSDRLVVVDEDVEAPYDRPPLSKEVLRGEWELDRTRLGSRAELAAEWRLGCRAVALDAGRRLLSFSDGRSEQFDGIVLATGASPIRLPGTDLPGVHVLRSWADAARFRNRLATGPGRVVVIGGGFIGQEVAASCRTLGLPVTMVEPYVPARHVVGDTVAHILAELHRSNGVDVRLGVRASAIRADARSLAVDLSDGSALHADLVVVGIGVRPNTDWLEGSGLTIDDGVLCDDTCLAAPGIVAAGDIARWRNPRYGDARRVEQWDNAVRQGVHAARRLLADISGRPWCEAYKPVPWFWSDQYGRKLQLVGSAHEHEEAVIVHGDAEQGRFVALYRRGEQMIAAFGMNSAGRIAKYRRLLETGLDWHQALSECERAA